MKKTIYALLFISIGAFAQLTKNVGDFNKVTSFDKIDVLLIPSNENKIILNGSGSEDVELVNKNGELKIRLPLTKLLSGDNISATVYFKNIDAVEANEGSNIASQEKIKSISFDIITKEGSKVKLELEVDKLTAKATEGSTVELKGFAKNQDVLVNAGSIYEAKNLITNQTVITTNAGSEADINATDFVDAKVRAGGSITIHGKPKQIKQKTIAGGKIIESKE